MLKAVGNSKNADIFWSEFHISVSLKLAVGKCLKSITAIYNAYVVQSERVRRDVIDRPCKRAGWVHRDAPTKKPIYYRSIIGADRLLDGWFLRQSFIFLIFFY